MFQIDKLYVIYFALLTPPYIVKKYFFSDFDEELQECDKHYFNNLTSF